MNTDHKAFQILHSSIILSAGLLLLLAGCQGRGESSPEQAAVRYASQQSEVDVVIDARTIEVVQTQAAGPSTYVMLAYQRKWNGRDETCLAVYESHREAITRWVSTGGSGSCADPQAPQGQLTDSLSVWGGTRPGLDAKQPAISYVAGRVNNPAIVKVSVMWQDGLLQESPVIGGAFLALRTGEASLDFAAGLDAQGEVVYTVQH